MTKHKALQPDHPLHLVAGFVIWSIGFVALYGGLSVGCAFMPPPLPNSGLNWLNLSLLVVMLALVILLLLLARYCWRNAPRSEPGLSSAVNRPPHSRRFISRVAACLYILAAAATLAVGLPLLALPPCV